MNEAEDRCVQEGRVAFFHSLGHRIKTPKFLTEDHRFQRAQTQGVYVEKDKVICLPKTLDI